MSGGGGEGGREGGREGGKEEREDEKMKGRAREGRREGRKGGKACLICAPLIDQTHVLKQEERVFYRVLFGGVREGGRGGREGGRKGRREGGRTLFALPSSTRPMYSSKRSESSIGFSSGKLGRALGPGM